MNETVSESIIKVLDKLGEQFGIALDWTGENVVPYIESLSNKIVSYQLATHWMWIIVGVLFTAFCIVLLCKSFSVFDDGEEWDDHPFWCFIIAVSVIALFIAIPTTIGGILELIKCYTFPELVAFEYIKTLLSSTGG